MNIRTTPVPDLPAIKPALEGISMNEERRITSGFNQGFFVRSLVLSHDTKHLLNLQPAPSLSDLSTKGYFSYAQVKPHDYLEMLEGALRRSP